MESEPSVKHLVPGIKEAAEYSSIFRAVSGLPFMNQQKLVMEIEQVSQQAHKRCYSLYDFLGYLWNAVWQEGSGLQIIHVLSALLVARPPVLTSYVEIISWLINI